MIEKSKLVGLLNYDPDTGIFRWNVSSARRINIGDVAGSITSEGYRTIKIDNGRYYAHRLAWLCVHGRLPKEIDHINGIRDDNRICNLRECSPAQNRQNVRKLHGTSKFHGVSWDRKNGKWQALITVGGRRIFLGRHTTEEDAGAAYAAAKRIHHTFNPEVPPR
jgi:hypothetical protein